MNIFLDARFYGRSGIGRYIDGLYKGILDNEPDIKIIAAGNTCRLNESVFKAQKIIPYTSPIYSLNEQVKGNLLVKRFKRDVDIIHIPNYNVPWFLPENSVVTVHDLTQFLFPEIFNRFKRLAAGVVLRNALNKAGRIVVVSESTKKDILKHYPEFEGKVKVVYNGISAYFKPLPEDEVSAFKKSKGIADYILYVGNRKPHKNIKRLLEAFSIIRNEHCALQIIIIGDKFSDVDEVDMWIKDMGLKGDAIKEVTKVSDEELHKYYCGAKMLVHPSLYEGFGFTPLEAMACGTPAVVSNTSSLPDICGNAAIYFDPYNVSDMVEKINFVLENVETRGSLIEKGLNRSCLFTWDRCAENTLKVFEEVLNS